MSLYNASSSAGNIIGPFLFQVKDKPDYKPGLRAILAIFVVMIAISLLQLANLVWMNKRKERERERNGKPAKIKDTSMTKHFVATAAVGPIRNTTTVPTSSGRMRSRI